MTSLTSERLLLREFKDDDWVSVHTYACDPEVVKYMTWGPNTSDDTRNFIRKAIAYQQEQPRKQFELAITLREEGHLIGGCGIRVSSPEMREGDIGYCLNRNYWSKGYATEAARELLRFGFKALSLHRIYATCDPENYASRRVLEKIGMTLEGHIRENLLMRGEWRDSLIYAILAREWENSNTPLH